MKNLKKTSFALTMLALFSAAVSAHEVDCSAKQGLEKLRCERHAKMAEKCGPLKGEAHFACDRDFLLANPLNCSVLKDQALADCQAEVKAFKTCEPRQGREFAGCVKKETGQSPMGH